MIFEFKTAYTNQLYASWIKTPIGLMLAIADEHHLYLLEFCQRVNLKFEIERLKKHTNSNIIEKCTKPLCSIEHELKEYFEGTLKTFKTSITLFGTSFQKQVWQELCTIPFGQTTSYVHIAQSLGKAKAFRAVAKANATNQLALIIPCHRVIQKNGKLSGYAAGQGRKEWLLNHEKQF